MVLWLMIGLAFGCPRRPPRRDVPREVGMASLSAVDAPRAEAIDADLAKARVVVMPHEPTGLDGHALRFGAWSWDWRTGEGRYAPPAHHPTGVWLSPTEPPKPAWEVRPADRLDEDGLSFASPDGALRVEADGAWLDHGLVDVPITLPGMPAGVSNPIRAVRVSPTGRFAVFHHRGGLTSVDLADATVIAHHDPYTWEDTSRLFTDPHRGVVQIAEHPVLARNRERGCLSEASLTSADCGFEWQSAALDRFAPGALTHATVDAPLVQLAPLAVSCADTDPATGGLRVRTVGKVRVYDPVSGALISERTNHATTWWTSVHGTWIGDRVHLVGLSSAVPRSRNPGTCGPRAEHSGADGVVRVWSFADGTWVSLTDAGAVHGTHTAGQVGVVQGDRFVPLLAPAPIRAEHPTDPKLAQLGGAVWLGLGLLAFAPRRRLRPPDEGDRDRLG